MHFLPQHLQNYLNLLLSFPPPPLTRVCSASAIQPHLNPLDDLQSIDGEPPIAHPTLPPSPSKPSMTAMDSQRPNDVSPEAMQARIQQARREAETLKDRIKRKKDELADTTCETRPLPSTCPATHCIVLHSMALAMCRAVGDCLSMMLISIQCAPFRSKPTTRSRRTS